MSNIAGWYADPAGMPQLRFWDGQSWTTATAAPPVALFPPPAYSPPYRDQTPPLVQPRRSGVNLGLIAGVAIAAVGIAVAVGMVNSRHTVSNAVTRAVSPAQHDSGYDSSTQSDIKNGSTAEETYFTNASTYTTNGSGPAGSSTGPLAGFSKSASTVRIAFTVLAAGGSVGGYTIVGVSTSGRSFCFNSTNSEVGIVAGSAC